MEPYTKPIFPHDIRKFLIDNDGRPFWREYYPNCVDRDPHAFFIESPAEIERYLESRQGHPVYIYFEKDKAYKPECLIMSYHVELDKEGSPILYNPEATIYSYPHVLGFAQNIPNNWFKEYNKERCVRLEAQTEREHCKRKENNEQK